MPTNAIKKSFEFSTQCVRTPLSTILKEILKCLFPALDAKCRSKIIAMDTIYSNMLVINNISTCIQIFDTTKTLVTSISIMKIDKQFVNTLEDNIRKRGAMNKLVSYRSQAETSKRVQGI